MAIQWVAGARRSGTDPKEVAAELVEMETAALRRWGAGDPDGYLQICDEDVTYFDPFIERRINGLGELTRYYDRIRGLVRIARFELVEPLVVMGEGLAVLSFNFVSEGGNDRYRWNCTEVYRHGAHGWRIVQTHWSWVQPQPSTSEPPAA
ncbi:YybH family protein [Streptomyces sp. NBC_01235]|uniref:YybH family protein n=1 Tax=Streptomyces sp. NBC_01235 TaxID=2903788 RepID=UPI002E0F9D3E|nr:nuclear transport factor 2 family protein [Streptomyces sp. NBC_01235]